MRDSTVHLYAQSTALSNLRHLECAVFLSQMHSYVDVHMRVCVFCMHISHNDPCIRKVLDALLCKQL